MGEVDGRVRILYVDDERSNRVVFQRSFEHEFDIVLADSGEAALELLATDDVGVVVSDQRMAGMSGNELLARVKELYPDVVRVVITAYSDLDPILQAVNSGLVARYVIKPWDREELQRLLHWCVEAHALGQRDCSLQLRLLETERLATVGSIAASVVHDMNQPLSWLTLGGEQLLNMSDGARRLGRLLNDGRTVFGDQDRQALSLLANDLPELADDVARGIQLLNELVQSLHAALQKHPTVRGHDHAWPHEVIRHTMVVCGRRLARVGGRVFYDGSQQLPQVTMSTSELTQVLINLVTNGVQAVLRSGQRGGQVRISARAEEKTVSVAVADTGEGMDEQILTKAFELFFTTNPEGSGIGLAQCRRIVERHGGTIALESALGEGATASLSLPRLLP